MQTFKALFSFFSVAILLSGCSVGMALNGHKEPNLAVCKVGADRSTVELQLGSPYSVATTPDGNLVATYEYEIGNEPSAGRAAFHGTMDLLTLGIWEAVGTPIEGFTGEKKRILIEYNKANKILAINSVMAEKKAPNTLKAVADDETDNI